MRRLPLRSGSCSVVVALYSLQHVRRGEIPEVLAEIRRVLTAAGLLLVAAHGGEGELGFDTGEFLGHQVGPSAITLYTEAELGGALRLAGFVLEETRTRGVTPGSAEVATTRHYLIARAA